MFSTQLMVLGGVFPARFDGWTLQTRCVHHRDRIWVQSCRRNVRLHRTILGQCRTWDDTELVIFFILHPETLKTLTVTDCDRSKVLAKLMLSERSTSNTDGTNDGHEYIGFERFWKRVNKMSECFRFLVNVLIRPIHIAGVSDTFVLY